MTSPGNYLRQNRIKIALWIAAVEGVLTIAGVIPRWVVYILAAVAVLFWAAAGRNYKSNLGRQVSWVFAASQAATVLVPAVWFIAKWVAILATVILAVVALIFLYLERDRGDHTAPQ